MPPKPHRKWRVKALNPQRRASSPLLALPAEIRNKIYEYALTAPEGLRVRWQAGRNRRQMKPVMLVDGSTELEAYPINRLQYVNRQFRKEVAGLEIQYNRVTFAAHHRREDVHSLKATLIFAARCTAVRRGWLTHIAIDGLCIPGFTPFDTRLRQWTRDCIKLNGIFYLCECLPHVRIDYRYPGFSYAEGSDFHSPAYFITSALTIMRLFRGTDVSFMDKHHDSGIMNSDELDEMLEYLLGAATCDEFKLFATNAPNLRFYPVDKDLPAQHFSKVAEEEWGNGRVQILSEDSAREGARLWTAEALKWIRDGI